MALPLAGPPPSSVPPYFRDRQQLSLALRTLLEHVGLGHLWGEDGPRTPAIDAFLQRSQLEVAAEAPVLRLVMGLWRGRAVFDVFEGLHFMGGRLHGTVMAFLAALGQGADAIDAWLNFDASQPKPRSVLLCQSGRHASHDPVAERPWACRSCRRTFCLECEGRLAPFDVCDSCVDTYASGIFHEAFWRESSEAEAMVRVRFNASALETMRPLGHRPQGECLVGEATPPRCVPCAVAWERARAEVCFSAATTWVKAAVHAASTDLGALWAAMLDQLAVQSPADGQLASAFVPLKLRPDAILIVATADAPASREAGEVLAEVLAAAAQAAGAPVLGVMLAGPRSSQEGCA